MISFEFDYYTEPQMMIAKEQEEDSPLKMPSKSKHKKRIKFKGK
jgi:hypothetical protein